MGFALEKETYYSPETYFEIEKESQEKYEYFFGEIVAMADGTVNHSKIAFNLQGELDSQLENSPCEVFNSDIKVEVLKDKMYAYPDVVLSCQENDLIGDNTMMKSPSLLIEVLSKSTAGFDTQGKLAHYLALPSLLYYLIVFQTERKVLCYERKDTKWELTLYGEETERIGLPLLNLFLTMNEIYKKVVFSVPSAKKLKK